MEKSNNYYLKVFNKFSKSKLSTDQLSSTTLSIQSTSKSNTRMIDFSSTFNKSIFNSSKSKRVSKLMYRDYDKNIKSYLSTLTHLQQSTLTDYAQTIASFLSFYPNCCLEDFENYLNFKSLYWNLQKMES